MSILFNELEDMKIYNRPLYLPINEKDRKHGSAVMLLTPSLESSINFINPTPKKLGGLHYKSYYLERDVTYYLNHESRNMVRLNDQVIQEYGSLNLRPMNGKGLDKFVKVHIDEDSKERYASYQEVAGIVEYFPWEGYLYTTEDEKLVAGFNYNVEDRSMNTMFVTEDQYNYLIPSLIEEIRKVKINEVSIYKDSKYEKYFKEYGFTEVSDDDGLLKLRYRTAVTEDVKTKRLEHYMKTNPRYKMTNHYLITERDSVAAVCEDFRKYYKLDEEICYVIGHTFNLNYDPFETVRTLSNDMKLVNMVTPKKMAYIKIAIVEGVDKSIKCSTVYSKMLRDAIFLAHNTNINMIVMDKIDEFSSKHGRAVNTNDIDKLAKDIRMKYGKNTFNRFLMDSSPTMYRNLIRDSSKIIDKDGALEHYIAMYGRVEVVSNESTDVITKALTESHMTFGYKNENFTEPMVSTKLEKADRYFSLPTHSKIRGISVNEGNEVRGSVGIDETNTIVSLNCTDIKTGYMLTTAARKYGANKVAIPNECVSIIEDMDKIDGWKYVGTKNGNKLYSATIEQWNYPDLPITNDMKSIYSKLSEEDRSYLGDNYTNNNCFTSTIYHKCLRERAMVDLYVDPTTPEIASIDIAVLEPYRGKGLARNLVKEAEDYVRFNFKNIKALQWICESKNNKSYNLAKKCGFLPQYKGNGYNFLYKILVKEGKPPINFSQMIGEEVYEEDTYYPTVGMFNDAITDGETYMMLQEDVDNKIVLSPKNSKFRKVMYDERIRTAKQIFEIYGEVKKQTDLKKFYDSIDKYKGLNLYVDLSYYNLSFFNNFGRIRGGLNAKKITMLYAELMKRLVIDDRLKNYNNKVVMVPVLDWAFMEHGSIEDKKFGKDNLEYCIDYNERCNPMSVLCYIAKFLPLKMKAFNGVTFLFWTDNGFFKFDPSNFKRNDFMKLFRMFDKLLGRNIPDDTEKETNKAIVNKIVDKIEKSKGVQINTDIKTDAELDKIYAAVEKEGELARAKELQKADIVKTISRAAEESKDTDEAIDKITSGDADFIANAVDDLQNDEDGGVKISAARLKRMETVSEKFLSRKKNNMTFKQYLETGEEEDAELPPKEIPIETINEDWHNAQFNSIDSSYDLDRDLFRVIEFFAHRQTKLALMDIETEDTSTTEDWKYTHKVKWEDTNGKRFTLKFDTPKLKDHRFMKLGGNDKNIAGQLVLIPVSKTEPNTAQIVTNYNKIFVRIKGSGLGKSTADADMLAKKVQLMTKAHPNKYKIIYGDNSIVSTKYDLPYDYTDLASFFYKFEFTEGEKKLQIYFNQDAFYKEYGSYVKKNIDLDKEFPIGVCNYEFKYDKNGKPQWIIEKTPKVLYYRPSDYGSVARSISHCIEDLIGVDNFTKNYPAKPGTKHMYSEASILSMDIPVIVVMAYVLGLQGAMRAGKVDYKYSEGKSKDVALSLGDNDYIRLKDGYLYYAKSYSSQMLMNGLKEVDTASMSIKDIDKRSTWTAVLDNFGGRIKADGLDNFDDLLVDPITKEVCAKFKLPDTFTGMLAYANALLVDTSYIKHTNLASNRYRSVELIAGYTYKALAYSFADYKNQLKRSRSVTWSIKQSAVLDAIMADPTCSDLSILNPLLEIEAKNSVSFKGLTGMNNDRSYSLDKRVFDKSMLNHIALSNNFSANVGISRQTTANMKIKGTRGYIKNTSTEDCSIPNTLSMTEALTPFGSIEDDTFRSAMTNIQTQKHNMRIKNAKPLLVTSGADEALPYMTGDTFSFKAKDAGKVIKKNDEYMIVKYKNGTKEIVDLRENVKKNSDGGFYVTIKLDTDLKVGQSFKKNAILAYDKVVYDNSVGDKDTIGFCIAALAKVAFIETDEGFEDSAIISPRLSDDLSSEVVVKVEKNLPKNTNIFSIAKVGQPVQEGDTILLYQAPFDEEDANTLVKNLSMDEKEVSELGRMPVRSKVTGVVQDIKLYRTVDKSELSPSLRKLFNEYEGGVKKLADEAKSCVNDIDLEAIDKLPATSKMKNMEDKIKIEFYLKYNDRMGVGDKLVFMSAIKGETKDIFPEGKEPYSEFRKDEIVDTFCPIASVHHRMVGSVLNLAGLYKGVVELTRQMKNILGIPYVPFNARKTNK